MSDNVSEKIIQQIHYCTNLINREYYLLRLRASGNNLGHGQVMLLFTLLRNDGLTQTELATQLRIRPASLGELVDKLEQNGYVERRRNENDKRIWNVYFTDAGRTYAKGIFNSKRHETFDTWCSGLSEGEKVQLSDLLSKLIISMEEMRSGNPEDCDEHRKHFGPGHMWMNRERFMHHIKEEDDNE